MKLLGYSMHHVADRRGSAESGVLKYRNNSDPGGKITVDMLLTRMWIDDRMGRSIYQACGTRPG